jgi:hypothetical protein
MWLPASIPAGNTLVEKSSGPVSARTRQFRPIDVFEGTGPLSDDRYVLSVMINAGTESQVTLAANPAVFIDLQWSITL